MLIILHLHENECSMEQYQTMIPAYRVPDISYKKKLVNTVSDSKRTRRHRNASSDNDSEKNVTVDDLLHCHFLCLKQLTLWKKLEHSKLSVQATCGISSSIITGYGLLFQCCDCY